MRLLSASARGLAWALLSGGILVVALNPAVPSLGSAIFWAGVMLVARGVARLTPWNPIGLDLALLFVCFFGMEFGGLIVAPSVLALALADATARPALRTA